MAAREEELTYSGSGGDPVRALLVAPDPAPEAELPGVVLVHGAGGPGGNERSAARRLAAEGFAALVPDLWSREGAPGPEPPPDRRALEDLDRAASALGERHRVDARRLAAVGFGAGGTLAFMLGCTSTRLAAVVSVHGPVEVPALSAARPARPLELALNLGAPFLALFGEADEGVPPEHVERMRAALEQGAKRFEIATFPVAGEGFYDESRPEHRPDDARQAWSRTLSFLRENLEA